MFIPMANGSSREIIVPKGPQSGSKSSFFSFVHTIDSELTFASSLELDCKASSSARNSEKTVFIFAAPPGLAILLTRRNSKGVPTTHVTMHAKAAANNKGLVDPSDCPPSKNILVKNLRKSSVAPKPSDPNAKEARKVMSADWKSPLRPRSLMMAPIISTVPTEVSSFSSFPSSFPAYSLSAVDFSIWEDIWSMLDDLSEGRVFESLLAVKSGVTCRAVEVGETGCNSVLSFFAAD
mmetsp:Transcript_32999/g.76032  ORF Transcript_32999/g.76032 Transcript_32999/m.76032 type:complete len:236 (+) Transcript_32999:687-1394(+)